ncbi:MAG: hypothetical protein NT165_00355 [Candidatus Falkowbacteria bacterium]|nr:hypothetical protein [Candidatus Falkowbacteria bacterium]
MDKKIIFLGMAFGSIIGAYIPTFFGAGVFSFASAICGALGGLLGIWLSWRSIN